MRRLVFNAVGLASAVRTRQLDADASAVAELVNGGLDVHSLAPGVRFSVAAAAGAIPTAWREPYSRVVLSGTLNIRSSLLQRPQAAVGVVPSGFGGADLVAVSFQVFSNNGAARGSSMQVWLRDITAGTTLVDTLIPQLDLSLAGRTADAAPSAVGAMFGGLYVLPAPVAVPQGHYLEAQLNDFGTVANAFDVQAHLRVRHQG